MLADSDAAGCLACGVNMLKQMDPVSLPFVFAAIAVWTILPVASAFMLSVNGSYWKSRQSAIARLDEDETR